MNDAADLFMVLVLFLLTNLKFWEYVSKQYDFFRTLEVTFQQNLYKSILNQFCEKLILFCFRLMETNHTF